MIYILSKTKEDYAKEEITSTKSIMCVIIVISLIIAIIDILTIDVDVLSIIIYSMAGILTYCLNKVRIHEKRLEVISATENYSLTCQVRNIIMESISEKALLTTDNDKNKFLDDTISVVLECTNKDEGKINIRLSYEEFKNIGISESNEDIVITGDYVSLDGHNYIFNRKVTQNILG